MGERQGKMTQERGHGATGAQWGDDKEEGEPLASIAPTSRV